MSAGSAGGPNSPIESEVAVIMGDLMSPDEPQFTIGWDTRPLRDDDSFWESPKYLDDGTPQFFVVTVTVDGHPNIHFADMSSPGWIRDYFIADWASDEISEDTREPRPECPLHPNTVMLAEMDSDRVIWKCTRDDTIRCDLGMYWSWRASL
jgi:hypothetical protein